MKHSQNWDKRRSRIVVRFAFEKPDDFLRVDAQSLAGVGGGGGEPAAEGAPDKLPVRQHHAQCQAAEASFCSSPSSSVTLKSWK